MEHLSVKFSISLTFSYTSKNLAHDVYNNPDDYRPQVQNGVWHNLGQDRSIICTTTLPTIQRLSSYSLLIWYIIIYGYGVRKSSFIVLSSSAISALILLFRSCNLRRSSIVSIAFCCSRVAILDSIRSLLSFIHNIFSGLLFKFSWAFTNFSRSKSWSSIDDFLIDSKLDQNCWCFSINQ